MHIEPDWDSCARLVSFAVDNLLQLYVASLHVAFLLNFFKLLRMQIYRDKIWHGMSFKLVLNYSSFCQKYHPYYVGEWKMTRKPGTEYNTYPCTFWHMSFMLLWSERALDVLPLWRLYVHCACMYNRLYACMLPSAIFFLLIISVFYQQEESLWQEKKPW